MLDLLGASAATIAMILEIIRDNYARQYPEVRIIKNTEHVLEYPYETEDISSTLHLASNIDALASPLFLGVYRSDTKQKVYDFFVQQYGLKPPQFVNLLHSQTAVAASARLGYGIQINPMSTIAPYAEIADFVSINRQVSIGHHTIIESFSTINPGVQIAGHCHIGEAVTLGMGALVLDGKQIGKGSIVAAGSLVTKDVPEKVLVMGSPAKIIREL